MKFIFLVLTLFTTLCVEAKRLAPKDVTPLFHAGLRYEAPHWAYENQKMKHNGGYVRVINTRNGMPICTKQVYETIYDANLEQDVQDNFITSLKADGHQLLITSEKLPLIKKSIANFCD